MLDKQAYRPSNLKSQSTHNITAKSLLDRRVFLRYFH